MGKALGGGSSINVLVLTVTHAGLNTVLESLARGVPQVAIPVSYDQPGRFVDGGEIVAHLRVVRQDRRISHFLSLPSCSFLEALCSGMEHNSC